MAKTEIVSRRENEVLALLKRRLSNADIAAELFISVRTVESHVSSLLRKYGATDRWHLAEIAARAEPAGGPPRTWRGLPEARTSFIGRQGERGAVAEAWWETRLVSLVGPGGAGKSRLASEIAVETGGGDADLGVYVNLLPVRSGFVAPTVAAALGVASQPPHAWEDAVAESLGHDGALLVLDNCEHVLDEAARLVDSVLTSCPGTRVLVTSRERLRLPGERVVPVGSLPLESDAESLFGDRARATDPSFDADPALVTRICARLDGLPLAIELAAARGAALGASALIAALGHSMRVLGSNRDPDERHRSLPAVIDWSYRLLEPAEQAVLRRLAVFAGEFDLTAALAICPDGDRARVADLIGRLVDKSLIMHQHAAGNWRLLQAVREFALEQLDTCGERADAAQRYLHWAAQTASELAGTLGYGWRPAFDRIANDLRAALASAPNGPDHVAHRLARSLAHLTFARRFLTESTAHFERAAEHAPNPTDAVNDLRAAATCAYLGTESGPKIWELLLRAAARAAQAGDGDSRALVLAQAVELAHRSPALFPEPPRPEQLADMLEEAAAVADPGNEVAGARLAIARAFSDGATPDTADPGLASEAVRAARRTHDPLVLSAALDALHARLVVSGKLDEAHLVIRERLALWDLLDVNDPHSAGETHDIAKTAWADFIIAGDIPNALEMAQTLADHDLLGGDSFSAHGRLALTLTLAGEFTGALRHGAVMWESWSRTSQPVSGVLTPFMAMLSLVCDLRGDREAAAEWRLRVARVAGPANLRRLASLAYADARRAIHRGDLVDAPRLVDKAFGDYTGGYYRGYAWAAGAELAVVAGFPDAADRLRAAEQAGAGNRWVEATLSRATGRLHHDPDLLRAAVLQWDRLGARFERACTLLLLPEHREEGATELAALGVAPYAGRTAR